MKVKVGDRIYDGAEEPVMAILSPEDKANIAAMDEDATRYCSAPDDRDADELRAWMREVRETIPTVNIATHAFRRLLEALGLDERAGVLDAIAVASRLKRVANGKLPQEEVWHEYTYEREWQPGIVASCCGLCENIGVLETTDGREAYCICQNGRHAREAAGLPRWGGPSRIGDET